MKKNKTFYSLICLLVLGSGLYLLGCGGSGSRGGSGSATLTGTVNTFTAALETEKKTMFAQIMDFIFSKAYAAASGVTVSVGGQSATTDLSGSFTINNISSGDQTVTFTSGSSGETYSLKDVDAEETFTLNDISVSSGQVTTEHTGTWTGTIEADDPGDALWAMTLTIGANGNSLSGTMTTGGETGSFSGTETGTSLDATYTLSDGSCTLSGPLTGTFSGTTLSGNAPVTADTCGLQPGDDDPDGHPFTLTKS